MTVEGRASSRTISGAMKRSVPLMKIRSLSVPTLSLSRIATWALAASTAKLPKLMSR